MPTTRTNSPAEAQRTPHTTGGPFRKSALSIGRRLALCFVLIVLSMVAADTVAFWQFRRTLAPSQRLNNADQTSLAIARVRLDVDTFRDKVAALESSHDTNQFSTEAVGLRQSFLQDVGDAQQTLSIAPEIAREDPTLPAALETLEVTLPSQLDTAVRLAVAEDWTAVRLRLKTQIQDLIELSSSLVQRVDRQVQRQRSKAIEDAQTAQRRLFIVVPVAGLLTLLVAVALGWYTTQSITVPLAELASGAQALARGDFRREVNVGGNDELAVVGRAFNQAGRQLQQLYEELRDSEEQWRAAFESNPTMYFIVDSVGTIMSVNSFGAEKLGYTMGELLGQPLLNVFYEPDKDAAQQHAQTCFQQPGRTTKWEARKIRKDGTMLWVRETANAVFFKRRPVLLVVCEDITEQKRAEEALQRSEAYLAEAQRLTQTGSWAYRAGGNALYWSEENFRIWGVDPQQGAPDLEIVRQRIHPEDRDTATEYGRRAVQAATDYSHEFRIVLPDGTVRHIRSVGHPVVSASGEVIEVVGTHVDVTERKHAEEERDRLRKMEAELAHINRVSMLGELAGSLGHEIKQPIAAAVTNANTCLRWLKRDHPDLEEAREAAARMVEDAMRASDIIDRMKSLYKKDAPQREMVNVNGVIKEIVRLLRNEAARHGISIRNELAADIPCVIGDRVQLQQVLMNLLINGIDAMKGIDGMREITISSQCNDNDELLVSVSDTGIGLPPDVNQIFDAFFTTKAHGTGMGLAISRTIVESHGGRLSATSNAGRGATFYFTLPAARGVPA